MVLTSSLTPTKAFDEFLGRLELDSSYDQAVQAHHRAVRAAVTAVIPYARTQLIGSLQRRTRIDPRRGLEGFDIDILVELGSFSGFASYGVTTATALTQMRSTVRGTSYSRMRPTVDAPTVVLDKYSDGSIVEIVPAYRDGTNYFPVWGRAYWVPGSGGWVCADYDYDAEQISLINGQSAGRLVRAIKLAKAWNQEQGAGLKGYHLEVILAKWIPLLIQGRSALGLASLGWPDFLPYVLHAIAYSLRVDRGLRIDGSYSAPADAYLSEAGRVRAAAEADRAARLADSGRVLDDHGAWRTIFGDRFPAC